VASVTATRVPTSQVTQQVLDSLAPPSKRYWLVVGGLASIVGLMFLGWGYQVLAGMGVAGINHPVGWGTYIINFVFWVGIAHSGTLISAVLFLFRVRWRTAISRVAEAMTVLAVMTAGLFPLIHLGRVWVMYFLFPYPNRAGLWPNFKSPLVWDVVAVSTYFTVSAMFFYLGMLPDLAAVRDRSQGWRRTFYSIISLGWSQRFEQWRHHARAYVCFACLATPLVISVHSVVSWDFAMSLLPGWHTTIFAPYFVAGAIHSGLAMIITLMLPGRKLLKLDGIIKMDHFENMAKLTVLTGLIVAYAYGIEVFMSWYSANEYEWSFAKYRAFGDYGFWYFAMIGCNCVAPMLFFFKRVRRSAVGLMVVAILINIGMWLERYVIIVASTSHDFLPASWGRYYISPIEVLIMVGAFSFFLMMFMLVVKFLPSVAMNEVKEHIIHQRLHAHEEGGEAPA
jgi:Ni/Fe-hydrogenase subunit HybB-like protein